MTRKKSIPSGLGRLFSFSILSAGVGYGGAPYGGGVVLEKLFAYPDPATNSFPYEAVSLKIAYVGLFLLCFISLLVLYRLFFAQKRKTASATSVGVMGIKIVMVLIIFLCPLVFLQFHRLAPPSLSQEGDETGYTAGDRQRLDKIMSEGARGHD